MPEGFDFGNSPFQLSRTDVEGKTIAQRTSAGTAGVTAATAADGIYAAALVNARIQARKAVLECRISNRRRPRSSWCFPVSR